MALLFIIFQDYGTVRSMIVWLFPDLRDFHIDMEKVNHYNLCLFNSSSHLLIKKKITFTFFFGLPSFFGVM
jgi:hypothetical protein